MMHSVTYVLWVLSIEIPAGCEASEMVTFR